MYIKSWLRVDERNSDSSECALFFFQEKSKNLFWLNFIFFALT